MNEYDCLKYKFNMLHINLNFYQINQFVSYYELMIEKNKVMNLTAITDFDEVVDKHFIDSLSLVNIMNLEREMSLIDVGTGAGFPGIPLKIAFPQLKVTLLDSLNKRILFLDEVIQKLQLENIETCHGRAEDYAHKKEFRGQYDLCVSRAVANLSTLSEYCLPFVKKSGYFVSYKSGNVDKELEESIKAVDILGGYVDKLSHFNLPETDFSRTLIAVKKIHATPNRYPRKAGTPSKEPLV